jgi:hypothetical protein
MLLHQLIHNKPCAFATKIQRVKKPKHRNWILEDEIDELGREEAAIY